MLLLQHQGGGQLQAGSLFPPAAEREDCTGHDAASNDDVLQQILGQAGAVPGLRGAPGTPTSWQPNCK